MNYDELIAASKRLDRVPLAIAAFAAAAALAPVGIILRKENGETAYET
jgi:hypothetical protein